MTRRKLSIALALLAIALILLLGLLLRSQLPPIEPVINYDASMSPTAPISTDSQATWSAVLTQRYMLTQTMTPEIALT